MGLTKGKFYNIMIRLNLNHPSDIKCMIDNIRNELKNIERFQTIYRWLYQYYLPNPHFISIEDIEDYEKQDKYVD